MNDQNIGILIVDDERIIRDSLSKWFEEDGFRTGVAENGLKAIEKLQENVWHVVLLDIKMPDMDGIELLKRIREKDKEIVVIMITAYGSIDTAVQSLKLGADDYITKPVDPEELGQIVRKAIQDKNLFFKKIEKQGMDIPKGLTALEALGIAIRTELDSQELYQKLAEVTNNEVLKDRFLNMSQEEKRHHEILEKKFKEMFPEVALKIPPSQLPGEIADEGIRSGLSVKEVLKHAIEGERKSREFYLDCAEIVTDLSGKRMFRFLADTEFSHQMMLTAELEMLEKYPAYYEGPASWDVETRFKTEKMKMRE